MAATIDNEFKLRVWELLDNAQDGGYDISDWSVDDIRCDLAAYADHAFTEQELQGSELAVVIDSWLSQRGKSSCAN